MKNRLQNQVQADHNPNSKSLQGQTKQRKTPAKRKFHNVGNLPSAAPIQPPAPPPAGAGQGEVVRVKVPHVVAEAVRVVAKVLDRTPESLMQDCLRVELEGAKPCNPVPQDFDLRLSKTELSQFKKRARYNGCKLEYDLGSVIDSEILYLLPLLLEDYWKAASRNSLESNMGPLGGLSAPQPPQPPAPPPAGAGQEPETYAPQHYGWPYDYTKLGLTALAEEVKWTDRKAIVHMATALRNCHKEIRRLLLPKIEDQKFALEVAEVLLMAIEIDAHQPDTITSSAPIWDTYLTGLTDGLASPRHMDDRTLLAHFALVISSPVAPFRDLLPCFNLCTAAHLAEALVIAEFITDCEGCETERTHSPTTSLQTLACELRAKHFMGQLERFEQIDNAA